MVGDDLRILVVDDNPDCRDLYSIWLGEDYDVGLAADGREGLTELDETVDVVFLDRDMPGPSGTEVASKISDGRFTPYVVMVSSMEPDIDIASMPIDDYVQKPVEAGQLTAAIEQFRKQKQYHSALEDYFSLSAKLAAIEAEKTPEELAGSERYERLRERVTAKRAEVDDAISATQTDWSVAFRACDSEETATSESQSV